MLKVAPSTVIRSYGRTSKFFRLDGLLQFCIIMGLRSASSALKGKFLVCQFQHLISQARIFISIVNYILFYSILYFMNVFDGHVNLIFLL